MKDTLKEIFGAMFEAMLQGEMEDHLSYESNHHGHIRRQRIEVIFSVLPDSRYISANLNE